MPAVFGGGLQAKETAPFSSLSHVKSLRKLGYYDTIQAHNLRYGCSGMEPNEKKEEQPKAAPKLSIAKLMIECGLLPPRRPANHNGTDTIQ